MSKVNQVTISPDKSMVSIGPGNLWQDVYRKIEPKGIAVSGGRWGSVGVGGLLASGTYQKSDVMIGRVF
jgi:FAD/FMN-containing dehydrogenase